MGTTKPHASSAHRACEQGTYLLGQPVDLQLLFLLQHFLFLFVKLLLKLQFLLILSQLLQAVILGFLILSFLSRCGILHDKGYKVVLTLAQHHKQGIQSSDNTRQPPPVSPSPSSNPGPRTSGSGQAGLCYLLQSRRYIPFASQNGLTNSLTSPITLAKFLNLSGPDSLISKMEKIPAP